jgi:hypothetical protein
MTRKLRTALTALVLLGLVAGGAGAAAADTTIDKDIDNDTTTIINDNDLIDLDGVLSNITTNLLGIQADDSGANVATASMY